MKRVGRDLRDWLRPHWGGLGGPRKAVSIVVRVLGFFQRAGVCLRKATQVEGVASICHVGAFEAMDPGPPQRS